MTMDGRIKKETNFPIVGFVFIQTAVMRVGE